jgi:superfamily II DNA/RNA helicase
MAYDQKEVSRLEEVVKLIHKLKADPTIAFVGSKEFGRKLSDRLNAFGIQHFFHNADLGREDRGRQRLFSDAR